jgi:membrane protein DedA with SNARE-associated domain
MVDFSQDALLQFLSQFVYEPGYVYLMICALMFASSFGFPVPEEVTIISVGLVGYLAMRPELLPTPISNDTPVHPHNLALVTFLAVFLSDLFVYFLGRYFGRRVLEMPFLNRIITRKMLDKIDQWSLKYGALAAGIFRFTPGLRFPGQLMCGVTKLSVVKFVAVDGTAALLSVPTQILLIAYYGDTILESLKQVKISILFLFLIGLIFYFGRRYWLKMIKKDD